MPDTSSQPAPGLLALVKTLIVAWTNTADAATAFIKTLDPDAKQLIAAAKAIKIEGKIF
jgi:hypothetical protein